MLNVVCCFWSCPEPVRVSSTPPAWGTADGRASGCFSKAASNFSCLLLLEVKQGRYKRAGERRNTELGTDSREKQMVESWQVMYEATNSKQ